MEDEVTALFKSEFMINDDECQWQEPIDISLLMKEMQVDLQLQNSLIEPEGVANASRIADCTFTSTLSMMTVVGEDNLLSPKTPSDKYFIGVETRYDDILARRELELDIETYSGSRHPDKLVDAYRKKFTVEPEEDLIQEKGPARRTLLDLFKAYSEALEDEEPDFHKRTSMLKKDANPLDFLTDCSIFSSDHKQRQQVPESLMNGSRIVEVQNYYKLNNLKTVSGLPFRISCAALSDDVLILGLVNHEVLEISVAQDKLLSQSKLEETITSAAISQDSSLFAAASTDGTILVKSTRGAWGKKLITSSFKEEYVDSVVFVNNREFYAMGCGKIVRIKMVKVGMLLEVQSSTVVMLATIPDKIVTKMEFFLEKSGGRLVVATPSEILFYRVTDKGQSQEFSLRRPDDVTLSDNVFIRQVGQQSLYTIFWGRRLLIVKKLNIVDDCNEGIVGKHRQSVSAEMASDEPSNYHVLESVDVGFKFDWGLGFDSVGLFFFRQDGTVRLATTGNFSQLLKAGCYYEPEETTYFNLRGMGRSLQAFSKNIDNKIINLEDGTVLIIDENKFKRLKLIETDKLIEEYVNCGEWHQAIKMAVKLFNSTPVSDNNSRNVTRDLIRIISVKYVDYFLPHTRQGDSTNILDTGDDAMADKRLRVIIQTLMMSDSLSFVFAVVAKKVKSYQFWRAIGTIVSRSSNYVLRLEYLQEGLAVLDESQIVNILDKTHKNIAEKMTEEETEKIETLVQALKRKEYWTALYKLGLQFPQSKAVVLFLSVLLSKTTKNVKIENLSELRIPDLFSFELVDRVVESLSPKRTLLSQGDAVEALRLFYFLRKLVHLDELSYAKSKTYLWKQLFDFMLDSTNMVYLATLNINLTLEIILESTLKPDVFLNQEFLYHLHRTIRSLGSLRRFQIVEASDVSARKAVRKLQDAELKDYSVKIVKELAEYVLESLTTKFGNQFEQDLGFMGLKLLSITLFKKLTFDTPFCLTCLKSVLSSPFTPNRLYYFYKLVTHSEFQEIVAACYSKVTDNARSIHVKVLDDLEAMSDLNRQ